MFKAAFLVTLHKAQTANYEGTLSTFRRDLDLSFVPYPGLDVDFGAGTARKITSVTWLSGQGLFRCDTGHEFPSGEPVFGLSYDELKADFIETGWNLISERTLD